MWIVYLDNKCSGCRFYKLLRGSGFPGLRLISKSSDIFTRSVDAVFTAFVLTSLRFLRKGLWVGNRILVPFCTSLLCVAVTPQPKATRGRWGGVCRQSAMEAGPEWAWRSSTYSWGMALCCLYPDAHFHAQTDIWLQSRCWRGQASPGSMFCKHYFPSPLIDR